LLSLQLNTNTSS